MTKRFQILELVRQGSKNAITLPAELQAPWDALVAAYIAQPKAKKKTWRQNYRDGQLESIPAVSATGLSIKTIYQNAIDADIAADTAVS